MPLYSACMFNTLTILSQNEIGDRKGPIAFHRIRKDGFIRKMKSIQILKMARVPCVGFPAHSLLLSLRLGDYRLREIKCRKHNKARFVFPITLIFFRICHLNQLYFFYIHNHFIIQKQLAEGFIQTELIKGSIFMVSKRHSSGLILIQRRNWHLTRTVT